MDLGAIYDGNPATRQLVESEYPAAAFYDDYLTMLASGSVDAVVICVPSYLHPERELSEAMDQQDISKLLSGHLDLSQYYSSEIIESEAQWGVQHAGMLANFAANILDGIPLIAPGAEGMNSVRLANAIHLSSWRGLEVPFDFDDKDYLSELNKRIRDENLFAEGA
jgi:predicted dehydrogenase